jgi:2-iminoacetate synthase ThiH
MSSCTADMTFEDPQLIRILDRLEAGQPLGREDALAAYRSHDLHGIAQLAGHVTQQRHGNHAWARQDLHEPSITETSNEQRIAALLAVGAAPSFEPPLSPAMSGHTYLKHVAVARLLLTGVDHIEVRLCPQVENVCQLALSFGADTMVGPDTAELERQILAAGRSL